MSTPKRDEKDEGHPVLKSLKEMEKILGKLRVCLSRKRYEEKYDLEEDECLMHGKF